MHDNCGQSPGSELKTIFKICKGFKLYMLVMFFYVPKSHYTNAGWRPKRILIHKKVLGLLTGL